MFHGSGMCFTSTSTRLRLSVPAEAAREAVGSAGAPDDVAWPIVHATVGATFDLPTRHPNAGLFILWWH